MSISGQIRTSLGCLVIVLLLASSGCDRSTRANTSSQPAASSPSPAIRLVDATEEAGVRFQHTSGRSGRLLLPETMGSGCGFLDYNHDGHLDLFLVNGEPLPGSPEKGPVYSALYRNRGDGTFEDVTRAAGLDHPMYGMGCAVGDYDNDGHVDLYVSGLKADRLYRNNGDSTFSDVTRKAGVSDPYYSTSCAWLDYDRDGNLDLFVGNYCQWNMKLNRICRAAFGEYICPPDYYKGDPPRLYRGRGDGTFEDATKKAGVYNPVGKTLGVAVFDVDDDGWPDLLIANDLEPNLLYRNNRDGTFREMGVEVGVAYSNEGKARAGMGIDTADFANNGREAIVIGNNTREGLALFHADGQGAFTDRADPAGLYAPSLPFLTFGALFVDIDNDSRKDVLVVNGNVNEHIAGAGEGGTWAQRPLLFRNTGDRFVEITAQAGPAMQKKIVARGLAAGDYDADGDLDFLISACGGPAVLVRNDTPKGRHWLSVRARGTTSNRSGIGTRVTAEAGGVRQTSWIRSGSSYLSANDLVAWFGLGETAAVERLTLRWPNGQEQVLTNVAADREILVEEGRGIVDRPTRQARG